MPSFQFYPGDWLRDAGLRACTAASRGVWMDLLCFMHDSPVRGHLLKANGQPFTVIELARAVGLTPVALNRHLAELESAGVFDRTPDKVILSRRMASDEEARRTASENGKKGGNPELLKGKPEGLSPRSQDGQPDANRGVNPPLKGGDGEGISPSSSSSSSSSSNTFPAAEPPAEGEVKKPPKKRTPNPTTPRQRNPLFDALAEVTGLDPATAGGLLGGVAATLASATTPYTAEDVQEFARRFHVLCPYAARDNRPRPTAKEVEKYIGLIRSKPPPTAPPPTRPSVIYDTLPVPPVVPHDVEFPQPKAKAKVHDAPAPQPADW